MCFKYSNDEIISCRVRCSFFRNIGGIYFDRYRFRKIIGSILNGSNFLWILENNIRQFLRSDYEDVLLLMTHFLRGVCHMAAHSAPSHSSMALSISVTAALIRQLTGRDISRRGLSPARALLSSNFNAIIFANLEQCNNVSAHQTFITLQLSLHLPDLIKHWWVWGCTPPCCENWCRAEETKGEYRNYVYHSGGMFFIATRGGFQHLLGSSSCEESLWVSTYLHIYTYLRFSAPQPRGSKLTQAIIIK